MISSNTPQCAICHLPIAQDTENHASCPFCQRNFARSDGARRHARTCHSRRNRSLPPDAKRGRRTRACDACSRVKAFCDAKTPCRRCSSRSLACIYGRLCTDPTHRADLRRNEADRPHTERGVNVAALLNWTDPTIVSLSDVVAEHPDQGQEEAPHQDQENEPYSHYNMPRGEWVDDTIDPRLLFLGVIDLEPERIMEYSENYSDFGQDLPHPPPSGTGTSDQKLADRMIQLAAELQQFAINKPHLQHTLASALPHAFLTSTNCSALVTAYARRRYYQSPIIHWPTFDPEKAALPLLLAIMLTGAAYTSRRRESPIPLSPTKAMQKIADKYIFSHIKRLTCPDKSSLTPDETLELCQAAFLINWLHIYLNDVDSRWRAITNRHPLLVGTLRRLGLTLEHVSSGSGLDWHAFIYRESCFRLVTWTFFIDSLLTVYCNHPPLMSLSEMSLPLSSNEKLWDADSSSNFEVQMSQEDTSPSVQCLKDLVAGFLREDWTDDMKATYDALSVRHLHAIIVCESLSRSIAATYQIADNYCSSSQALQPIIFNYHTSLMSTADISVILVALKRWEPLWDHAIERLPDDQKRWLGIAGYSRELAWLTRRIVEVSLSQEGHSSKYLQRAASYNTTSIHQFIHQFRFSRENVKEASLHTIP